MVRLPTIVSGDWPLFKFRASTTHSKTHLGTTLAIQCCSLTMFLYCKISTTKAVVTYRTSYFQLVFLMIYTSPATKASHHIIRDFLKLLDFSPPRRPATCVIYLFALSWYAKNRLGICIVDFEIVLGQTPRIFTKLINLDFCSSRKFWERGIGLHWYFRTVHQFPKQEQ